MTTFRAEAQAVREPARDAVWDAVVALDREHGQRLYGYALRLGIDPGRAADLVQEALIRLWRELGRGTAIVSCEAWTYGALAHLAADERRLHRRIANLVTRLGERAAPRVMEIDTTERVAIWAQVDRLPDRQRQVVYLRYQADLTYEEIGGIMGIEPGAARSYATRLIAAIAIASLGTGALLLSAGVGPSPAPVASPSPAPWTPPAGWVTEEVEPGVFRVLSDGTDNDLDPAVRMDLGTTEVVAGQDGSVWIYDAQFDGEGRLFRLGVDGAQDATRLHDAWPDISVAPDGTLWALGDSATNWPSEARDAQLLSLSGGEWTPHDVPEGVRLTGIETPADGSVWASWAVGTGPGCPGGNEGDVAAGGRLAVGRLVDGEWVEQSIEPALRAGDGGSLAIGSDETALLGTTYFNSCPKGAWLGIVERGADGWAPSLTADPRADESRPGIGPIAIGSDGTVWAYQDVAVSDEPNPTWDPRLLRRTDGAWELLGDDESVPALIGSQTWDSSMTVSPDGRLWIALDGPSALEWHRDWGKKSIAATLAGPCAGVLSYDGTAWSHHLAGACATDVSAAPNGDVWVTVGDIDPWLDDQSQEDPERVRLMREGGVTPARPGLYVITPEAVAATDQVIAMP